jgi:hypothetical protein
MSFDVLNDGFSHGLQRVRTQVVLIYGPLCPDLCKHLEVRHSIMARQEHAFNILGGFLRQKILPFPTNTCEHKICFMNNQGWHGRPPSIA